MSAKNILFSFITIYDRIIKSISLKALTNFNLEKRYLYYMVIVIVSPVIAKIIPALEKRGNYKLIKSKGPKGFFFIPSDISFHQAVKQTKALICQYVGSFYVFEVYGLYNGMIDLFSYLPDEKKNTEKYYTELKKDLSDEELEQWKTANL